MCPTEIGVESRIGVNVILSLSIRNALYAQLEAVHSLRLIIRSHLNILVKYIKLLLVKEVSVISRNITSRGMQKTHWPAKPNPSGWVGF